MPSFVAKVETEIDVDFEVFCGGCGAGICNNSTGGQTKQRGHPYVKVNPCEKCLAEASDKGYEKGFLDGEAQGEKNMMEKA